MRFSVSKMVKMGVLCSLAIILMIIVRFPIIPTATFLEYEPSDVPILVGAFMFGPVAGLFMTVVVSFIQAITVSASSGFVGFLMHAIATGTLVFVAGLIYKKVHNFKGAIIALVAGSLSMTAIMIPLNLIIDPILYKMPLDAVIKLILPAFLPFNLAKAGINSVIVASVYKPIATFLRATGNEIKYNH